MITYKPFWETLKKKGITTYKLINYYEISNSTIQRLRENKGITTTTIDDFCKILDCRVEDIVEYVKEESDK